MCNKRCLSSSTGGLCVSSVTVDDLHPPPPIHPNIIVNLVSKFNHHVLYPHPIPSDQWIYFNTIRIELRPNNLSCPRGYRAILLFHAVFLLFTILSSRCFTVRTGVNCCDSCNCQLVSEVFTRRVGVSVVANWKSAWFGSLIVRHPSLNCNFSLYDKALWIHWGLVSGWWSLPFCLECVVITSRRYFK